MFARSVQLPTVERLKRGWGKWHGRLIVAELPEPLDLVIEAPRSEPVEPLAERAASFAATFGQLRDDFAEGLFQSYQFVKKADLERGNVTEADFAEHPSVRSPQDVWSALRPYRLCLFSPAPADRQMGNAYLLIDVDWPNPHFFQLLMKASAADGFKYVHTEIVG